MTTLKLSSVPPTEPGYYWIEYPNGARKIKKLEARSGSGFLTLEVRPGCDFLVLNEVAAFYTRVDKQTHLKWAGPIPQPEGE